MKNRSRYRGRQGDTAMPLPTVEEFNTYLLSKTLLPASVKGYRSGYRRIRRDLNEETLLDDVTVQDYRRSMKVGTRNVFDSTWKQLQAGWPGLTKDELPDADRVRFTHPLMHDLTFLSGTFRLDKLGDLRWGDLRLTPMWGKDLQAAALRVFQFQYGEESSLGNEHFPVIPALRGSDKPMAAWRVEHIINSAQHATDSLVDQFSERFTGLLVASGFTGFKLREYTTLLWQARFSILRAVDTKGVIREIENALVQRQYVTAYGLLNARVGTMPTVPPLW